MLITALNRIQTKYRIYMHVKSLLVTCNGQSFEDCVFPTLKDGLKDCNVVWEQYRDTYFVHIWSKQIVIFIDIKRHGGTKDNGFNFDCWYNDNKRKFDKIVDQMTKLQAEIEQENELSITVTVGSR